MAQNRLYVIFVLLFPLILTVGIVTIPVVSDYANHILAEQATEQTGRWFWGHAISAIAFGISILAATSINHYLSMKGQARFGNLSLLLIAVGGALYAFGLGADGIGPLAASAGGSRALVFFEGSGMWIGGVFISASIIFGLGIITQVMGMIHAGSLIGVSRILVFIAAIIFVGAGIIPSGWGLYVVAVAALLVYLPIGMILWRESYKAT